MKFDNWLFVHAGIVLLRLAKLSVEVSVKLKFGVGFNEGAFLTLLNTTLEA